MTRKQEALEMRHEDKFEKYVQEVQKENNKSF